MLVIKLQYTIEMSNKAGHCVETNTCAILKSFGLDCRWLARLLWDELSL